MKRLYLGLIPLMAAAAFGTAWADDAPFDGRLYVAPMGSYTIADKSRGTDDGFGGTLAVGKRITRNLELELLGDFTDYDTKQGDFSTPQPKSARAYGLGGGANFYLLPSAPWYARGLLMHVDVMRGQVNGQPGPLNNYKTTLFDAGLGWDFPLDTLLGGLIGPGFTLRTEALYHLDLNNQNAVGTYVAGENGQNKFNEVQFNIGLRLPIGGHRPAEAPPESAPAVVPVEEAPAPAPADSTAPPPAADGAPAPAADGSAPAPAESAPAPADTTTPH